MKLHFSTLILLSLLFRCQQASESFELEIIELSTIKEDLMAKGKDSKFYDYAYVDGGNNLDSTFANILEAIEPYFVDSLYLDSKNFTSDYHKILREYFAKDSWEIETSCKSIPQLFEQEECRHDFLTELLKTDYDSSTTIELVIYQQNRSYFEVYGPFWSSTYLLELNNGKIQIALLQSIIE